MSVIHSSIHQHNHQHNHQHINTMSSHRHNNHHISISNQHTTHQHNHQHSHQHINAIGLLACWLCWCVGVDDCADIGVFLASGFRSQTLFWTIPREFVRLFERKRWRKARMYNE
jgi:hypothetical protein